MSYSTDSYIQEDTCTFPVYQRLRKINPYAYYSLDAQKQIQQDLREAGSLWNSPLKVAHRLGYVYPYYRRT